MRQIRMFTVLFVFNLVCTSAYASLNIAVASNFKVTAQNIAQQFTEKTKVQVKISSASTATLYQQILRGAPFDVYLAADQKHVNLLKENETTTNVPFIYAQGRLAFWQPDAVKTPTKQDFLTYTDRLAIANPKFAPYGIAAQEVLIFNHKWPYSALIQGNNINQAYQFVESKNVAAGLVSYAALIQKNQEHYFLIPVTWHKPIIQSGIITTTKNQQQAELFRDFLLSKPIQQQIQMQGYN